MDTDTLITKAAKPQPTLAPSAPSAVRKQLEEMDCPKRLTCKTFARMHYEDSTECLIPNSNPFICPRFTEKLEKIVGVMSDEERQLLKNHIDRALKD